MADPASVPAGKYGKAALEALGVWPSVASKIAPAQDVRATLLLVSRGEAPLGIVYQTDAAADKSVKIIGAFPESTHPPIVYPIAVTTASTNAGAAAYIGFLKSPAAKPAFETQGFDIGVLVSHGLCKSFHPRISAVTWAAADWARPWRS